MNPAGAPIRCDRRSGALTGYSLTATFPNNKYWINEPDLRDLQIDLTTNHSGFIVAYQASADLM